MCQMNAAFSPSFNHTVGSSCQSALRAPDVLKGAMTGLMTPSTAQLATQPTEGNKINRGPWCMLAQLKHQRIQRETQ